MNRAKRTFQIYLIIVVSQLTLSNLFAQPQRPQGPPMLPDSSQIVKMVDELTETLSLTEKQKKEISDLYFSHFSEAENLMKKHKGDRENHRKAMEALRNEFDEQVKAVLNDEQKTEYDKLMKNHKPRQKPRR